MGSCTDTAEVEIESEAQFAIDVARSKSLPQAIALYGRKPVFLMWRMGWCAGYSAGVAKAQRIMTDGD